MSVMDKIRNNDIKERCGYSSSTLKRLGQRILKWFGHKARIESIGLKKKSIQSGGERTHGKRST